MNSNDIQEASRIRLSRSRKVIYAGQTRNEVILKHKFLKERDENMNSLKKQVNYIDIISDKNKEISSLKNELIELRPLVKINNLLNERIIIIEEMLKNLKAVEVMQLQKANLMTSSKKLNIKPRYIKKLKESCPVKQQKKYFRF